MQLLLTLAGSLFLVAYATAASVQGQPGPCTKQNQLDMNVGRFLPQCTEFGFYEAKQCHGSTGYCWCVVPDTGKEITGTRVAPGNAPKCTACFEQRALALRPFGHVGNFVPSCDDNGQFTAKQVHGSTGFAWCVDQSTGTEVEGTRARGQVECNTPVAASLQAQPGPCTKERQLGTEMPGKFLPQCTEYGYYNAKQCHGSTGYCWCVVPDTGKEITGTRVAPGNAPKCPACYEQRALALRPFGHVGNFVPSCDDNGLFTAKQFHGSTGFTWCVDQSTGAEVEGTRARGQVECNGPVAAASFIAINPDMDKKGPCDVEVAQKSTRIGTIGLFMPHCTANGYYKTEQMHSSTGYRWCVNPETGAEVQGTRKGPAAGKLECGACFKQIEEKLRRQPIPGYDIPQCDQIGNYVPEQSREGHRFCVNPTTGAVEGKILAPGDLTKLECKH